MSRLKLVLVSFVLAATVLATQAHNSTSRPEQVVTSAAVSRPVMVLPESLTTTTAPPPPTTTTTRPPTTTTQQPPKPAPAPVVQQTAPKPSGATGDPYSDASWERLAQCESGGDWAANTGNSYFGGIQFSLSSWQAVGGTGYPHEASRATQIAMGQRLYAQGGWGHWPGCSRSFGWI